MKDIKLTEQLLLIIISIILIIVISLGIILPNRLIPVYESQVYNYLREPLSLINNESVISNDINTEVAYIYINNMLDTNVISVSDNLNSIIDINDINTLLKKIDILRNNGKFVYKMKTYYYVTLSNSEQIKIALTDDTYINKIKNSIITIIIKVVGITLIITSLLIVVWSTNLVNRIKKLEGKINNINNDNYNHKLDYNYNDELYTLDMAIENMRVYLKEQEEYKNQMYQNISHDFKTPITVMKSYIEAYEDKTVDNDKMINVLREQLKKLETKVHSLLYLNKLNYFQDKLDVLEEQYDISNIVYAAVDKFKVSRPDVEFVLDIDKNNTVFRGNSSMWEAIIDNILNNFIRYAKKKIKITIKNNKIILFNDGENIDENVLNNIFTPYEKGVKGVFGLGLSIVKKTLHFLGYDISIVNIKNGVKFTIYDKRK